MLSSPPLPTPPSFTYTTDRSLLPERENKGISKNRSFHFFGKQHHIFLDAVASSRCLGNFCPGVQYPIIKNISTNEKELSEKSTLRKWYKMGKGPDEGCSGDIAATFQTATTRSLCARETMIISFYIFVKLHVFYIIYTYIGKNIKTTRSLCARETMSISFIFLQSPFYFNCKISFTSFVKYLFFICKLSFTLCSYNYSLINMSKCQPLTAFCNMETI